MPAYACKVKYDPRVIASFRRFDETAISKMVLQQKGYPDVATRMEHTYRNAIIGMHTFGGCAIDYDDLMDLEATNWAENLSVVTGLKYSDLMAARAEITKPRAPFSNPTFCLDPKLDSLYEELCHIKKAAVPPSRQYLNHRFLEAKELSEQEAGTV